MNEDIYCAVCGKIVYNGQRIDINNISKGISITIHTSCMITIVDYYKIHTMVNKNEY